MFRQILIPTDGSAMARKAVDAAIAFAKETRASVVAYYAVESIERLYLSKGTGSRPQPLDVRALEKQLREQGEEYVAEIRAAAEAAGVPCDTVVTSPATPFQGIIDASREKNCDIIFIASHGRDRLATLLLGSVTQKVLAHSKIPVLVYR